MASLVDQSLVSAVRGAGQGKREAMRDLIAGIGRTVGDVGGAAVERYGSMKDKRAQVDAYRKALEGQETNLQAERDRLASLSESQYTQADTGELSEAAPYLAGKPLQSIDNDVAIRSIDKRLGEIGTAKSQLPNIGDLTYMDHDRAALPQLGRRKDYEPTYGVREYELGQQAAERADAKAYRAAQEKRRRLEADRSYVQRGEQIKAASIRAEPKPEKLSETQRASLSDAVQGLDAISNVTDFIDENESDIGKYAGKASKAKQFFTGEGAASRFDTLRGIAVKVFGRFLEGGKLAEGDQRAYEAIAGDVEMTPEQLKYNFNRVADAIYKKAMVDIETMPDAENLAVFKSKLDAAYARLMPQDAGIEKQSSGSVSQSATPTSSTASSGRAWKGAE